MKYVIANIILILIGLIGSFMISKSNEGIFMGINDFFVRIYLLIIGIIAVIINTILIIVDIFVK